MRVAVQQFTGSSFRLGTDDEGRLTLYVVPELLPDDALEELGRVLAPLQLQRATDAA